MARPLDDPGQTDSVADSLPLAAVVVLCSATRWLGFATTLVMG